MGVVSSLTVGGFQSGGGSQSTSGFFYYKRSFSHLEEKNIIKAYSLFLLMMRQIK
ncbi:MAG: hypothetical protein LBP22_04645 [Deltaproteobacteria bacterium]|jgi:hypothetical protein|nr:hypothetical protein [Deltaproteobacteria bacterium]